VSRTALVQGVGSPTVGGRRQKMQETAKFSLLLMVLVVSLVAPECFCQGYARLHPMGDIDGNRIVDLEDLRILADQWLNPGCLEPGCEADLDGQNSINVVDFAILAENWGANENTPVISEFLVLNGSKEPLEEGELLDEDGDSSDWIEIYNPTDAAVNLKGWYLTNDANDLRRWELPYIQISPGQFKIIFASEKNRDDPDDELHTNFCLNGGAGFLALVKPDGKTIAHAYDYPQQFGDISYGLADPNSSTSTTQVLVPELTDAKALIPTDGVLGLSWIATDFNDSSWLKGPTGVGYNYGTLIGLDVSAMRYNNATAYIRILFEMDDLSNLEGLKLLMNYDDGFIAYLNGCLIDASTYAPANPQYNSSNNGNDHTAVGFEEFPLPDDYIDYLQIGTNVLAIHGLNKNTSSSDLLILPKLTVNKTETIDFSSAVEGYFFDPTPGRFNGGIVINLGPAIRNVTENPPQPTDTQNLIITAQVTETFEPVAWVKLFYRVDFGSETGIQMFDDGLHNDEAAADFIYGAVIPPGASGPSDCVRWFVTASDVNNNISRNPLFLVNSGNRQSPQYFGTVVSDPSINTVLPVFHYFVQDTAAEGTRTGTRASLFFLGEFYDNVHIRLRGGYTTHGRKIGFNDGHHFCFDPNLPRVDEINLNEKGADPTYMRQVMGWETYINAGQPGSISFPLHVRRNGSFLDVRIFIEQEDRDMLRRNGLDPDGALYKMYDDLQNGQIDGEGVHEKKTRLDESAGDLLALAAGINTTNPSRNAFVFDNVNIPAMVNYWASSVIMHENDHTHKNYYAYRDTQDAVNNPDGTNEWMFLPWDKDLTFGINNGIGGIIADQDWPGDVRSPSHPFYGCSEHQKNDYQWNCLIDALHDNPVTRQIYLRRLRTLMDTLLQPPGTPAGELKFEKRINELTAQFDADPSFINLVGSSTFHNNVNLIKTAYLAVRRPHLFVNHSIHNPAYNQNAGIPDAQPDSVTINFGTILFNPPSGNQDEEYIQLNNPNAIAVDISGWRLEGGVQHIFPPGTVIPAGGSLYVTPNAVAFRNRTTSPKGGEQRFVQGNYKGHLSSWGETINLLNSNRTLVSTVTYTGNPSDQQRYLRITEIMFNPAQGGAFDNEQYEFIELKNIGTASLPLLGVKFTEGIYFSFPFPNIDLPPGGYVVVAKNQTAFASRWTVPDGVQVLGPYDGQLSNSAENVKLDDSTNSTIWDFTYRDGWFSITDGGGFSLTIRDPNSSDLNNWDSKSGWRTSAYVGGSPGWDDSSQMPDRGTIVINELLAHSHGEAADWIELFNTSGQTVNIGGWFLSDNDANLQKYEIAEGTTIGPSDYFVFYQDANFSNPNDPGCHEPFALSENGETVSLHCGRDGQLMGEMDIEEFDASETGISFGRYQKSTGTYNFVAMSENTPWKKNAYPKVGPIVISEIMYHPDPNVADKDAEYVELLNISASPVSLQEYDPIQSIYVPWRFIDEGGISFDFPPGVTIVSGEYLLLVKNKNIFDAYYPGVPGGVKIFQWENGNLSNGGEKIELSKPGDEVAGVRYYIQVDRVNYDDELPWPATPDGSGASLNRLFPQLYGNDPNNWSAATPSPASP